MEERRRETYFILFALYFLAGVTFTLTVARYLNSPLRSDEVSFPTQVAGIIRHGVPKVLYSEDRLIHTYLYYGYDALYGMWHPPLYLYSLSVPAALFGIGNIPMRAVGLVWFILSLWLVWCIAGVISDKPTPIIARGIPLALILLTPLLVEGSLYLDIDNTSLAFSLLLFAWFYLKSPQDESLKRLFLLGLIFTFSLWSKLTTPFIMLASVLVYQCLNRNFKKGILQSVVIGGFGIGLFLLTYWIYCHIFNYPFWFMFDMTYFGKSNMYLFPHALKRVLHSLRWNFVWISPAISIMLGILAILRIRSYISRGKLERMDFLVIFALLGLATYTFWGGLWGKYTFPVVLAGVTAVGFYISNSLTSIRIRRPVVFMSFLLMLAIIHLIAIPNLQVKPPGFDLRSAGLWQAISDIRNLYLLVIVTAIIIFFSIAWRFIVVEKREAALFIMLLIYLLAANPINSMKIIFSPGDLSPYHPFQEKGFVQTIQFINYTLGRDDVIFAPRDIGFYFHGRYYPTDDELAKLQKLTDLPRICYIVDSENYPAISVRGFFMKTSSIVLLKRIGTFAIYQCLRR